MLLFYGLSPCWYLILHICWCPNSIYNAFTMIIVSCSCFEIYALSHFNLCDELRGHFVECLSWTEPVFLIWPSRFWADFTSDPPPCHLMLTVSVWSIDSDTLSHVFTIQIMLGTPNWWWPRDTRYGRLSRAFNTLCWWTTILMRSWCWMRPCAMPLMLSTDIYLNSQRGWHSRKTVNVPISFSIPNVLGIGTV